MSTKRRSLAQKVKDIAAAWEQHAPDVTFGGMTLTQFNNKVKPSLDARDESQALKLQRRAKRGEIVTADAATRLAARMVVKAVEGDPAHGPDSALVAAMGFVPDSLKRSGKTNRSNGNGNGNGQPHA